MKNSLIQRLTQKLKEMNEKLQETEKKNENENQEIKKNIESHKNDLNEKIESERKELEVKTQESLVGLQKNQEQQNLIFLQSFESVSKSFQEYSRLLGENEIHKNQQNQEIVNLNEELKKFNEISKKT